MTAIALIVALALGFTASAGEAPPDAAAVEAYRAGDLGTARGQWIELLEANPPLLFGDGRARVMYDLGNVAGRRGKWLEAVGWYTASLRLRPRDADAWANLEYARMQAELDPADRGDLADTLVRLLGSLTPEEGAWLALAGLLPLLACLLGEALRGGLAWRRLSWTAFLLAVASASPWVYERATGGGDPLLIVAADGAPVRSEPRSDASSIERVEVGSELERVDQLPGWVRVELADGNRGWTRERAVFALRR